MYPAGKKSKEFIFPYYNDITINDDGKESCELRPKIEVALRSTSEPANKTDNPEYQFFVLVDSGADVTSIPREVANILRLGLNPKTITITNSASEGYRTFNTTVYAEIIIGARRTTIGQIPIVVPEKYVNPDENADVKSSILLGRHMVFEKFVIIFDEAEHKVIFRVP